MTDFATIFPVYDAQAAPLTFPSRYQQARYELISRRMAEHQSCTMNACCPDRAERAGAYRFLNHPGVTERLLQEQTARRCARAAAAAGPGDKLVISDTCEVDLGRYAGRLEANGGLGAGSKKGREHCYFVHPQLVVEEAGGTLLGVAEAFCYHRAADRPGRDSRHDRAFEDKESVRWLRGAANAHARLRAAGTTGRLIYVSDREADNYGHLAGLLALEGADLVVRARHDRACAGPPGAPRLFARLAARPVVYCYKQRVRLTPAERREHGTTDKWRWAHMEVRAERVVLEPPRGHGGAGLRLGAVWARERTDLQDRPDSYEAVDWKLLTTLAVTTAAELARVLGIYERRWLIEELFFVMKSGAFGLSRARLHSGRGIRKLTMLIMDNSLKVVQLREAQRGRTQLPCEAVFDEEQRACLAELLPGLQGRGAALRNPHAEGTLAHASWIIARLGGWKGYATSRPPGVQTMSRGLERFEFICYGRNLNGP